MSQQISIGDIGLAKTGISSFATNCEIEQIAAECFKKSKNIVEICISSVNQKLPDEIFSNCSNLTSLQLPPIQKFDTKIFGKTKRSYPKKLKSIVFSDGTEDIGCILSGMSSLENARLPATLRILSSSALYDNIHLRELTVPRNAIVEDKAFETLESLESLSCVICELNHDLGLSALQKLKNVTLLNPENSFYAISSPVLAGLTVNQLSFEDHAAHLGSLKPGALSGMPNIVDLDFANSLIQELPTEVFAYDQSLSSVQMNANCFRALKANAFRGVPKVTLAGNQRVNAIEYPGTQVTYADDFAKSIFTLGPSAFYQAEFKYPIEMLIDSIGDSAFEESNTEAVFLQFGKSMQRELKTRTFAECKKLKTAFATAVSCIGKECFYNCKRLERFNADQDFYALEHSFENCSSLSAFPIAKLKYAGDYSFAKCTQLVSEPAANLQNVGFFGKSAFSNVLSCDCLELDGTLLVQNKISQNAFEGCNIAKVRLYGISLDDLRGSQQLSASNLVDLHLELQSLFGIANDAQFELDDAIVRKDGKGNRFSCLVTEDGVLGAIDSSSKDYKQFLESAVIPYDITEIGEKVFSHFTQLSSIDLNNVMTVDESAFADCQNLKVVAAPKLQTICKNAFANCISLEQFDFSSVQTVKKNAFQNCAGLLTVKGDCIVSIDEGAFLNCQALKAVQSSTVMKIGQIAFGNCIALEEADFKQSELEAVDKYTFIGCSSLSRLLLGNRVQLIDEFALKDTNSHLVVTFDGMYPLDVISLIKDDNLCGSTVGARFGICSNGKDRILLETVREDKIIRVQDNAQKVALFKAGGPLDDIFDVQGSVLVGIKDENVTTTEVSITGNSITAIAPHALATTRKLTKLTVNPSNELSIASQAFSYNSSLKEVVLANSRISNIASDAFWRCAIQKMTLPPLLSVNGYGLNESYALSSLVIADGTKTILASAMIDCGPTMTDVKLPTTVEEIGNYAFAEMHSYFPNLSAAQLKELTNLTKIGDYAFYNSMRTTDGDVLRIPSKVKSIGVAAFGYNEDAWTFTISALEAPETMYASNVQTIGPSAFIFNGLRDVKFNTSSPTLSSIGEYAFAYPKKKFSIRIPSSIRHIGIGAFKKNVILNPDLVSKNIISVDLNSDSQILEVIGSLSSSDFTAPNTISVSDYTCILATGSGAKDNQNFLYALDGKLNLCPDTMKIDIQTRTLLSVTGTSITSSLIPKYINVIGEAAYKDCVGLTSVSSLNPNVQMQASAFYNCSSLQQFNGPSAFFIDKADPYLFWNCQMLDNIRLLSTAEYVGECAFYNCKTLTALQDKNTYDQLDYWTLKSIGPSAFLSCSNLQEFTIPKNILSIGVNSFDCCSKLKRITIDCTSQQFKEIVRRGESEIGEVVHDMFNGIRPDAQCEIVFNDIVYMNDGDVKLDNDIVGIREIEDGLSAISAVDIFELEDRQQDYLNLSALVQIDNFVFRGVDSLRTFNILPSDDLHLTSIGDYAFSKCTSLEHIDGDKLSCATIGQHAFDSCKKLYELQLDLNSLKWIEKGAFARSGLKHLVFFIDSNTSESDEDEFLDEIKRKVNYDEHICLNPMMLPEECQIVVINGNGTQIGLYDCQFNSLMHSDIDMNRNQMVFVDKDYGSIKPLLLVKPIDGNLPAIAKNEFHVNIIGRWR